MSQTLESNLNNIKPCCGISASSILVIRGLYSGKSSLRTGYISTSYRTTMPGNKAKAAQGVHTYAWKVISVFLV